MNTDLEVADFGSIFLLTPQTEMGRDFCTYDLQDTLRMGVSVCVEPRYIQDLCAAILTNTGLTIEKDGKQMKLSEAGYLVLIEEVVS